MRFVSKKMSGHIVGVLMMLIMMTSMPLILLLDQVAIDDVQFLGMWWESIKKVAPISIPPSLFANYFAKKLVSIFVVQSIRNQQESILEG